MKRVALRLSSLAVMLCSATLLAAAPAQAAGKPPIHVTIVSELSGTGTTAGTNFKNGVEMALKEINAAGGVLGAQVDYEILDSQSTPGVAKALVQKAVDAGSYVVFGPTFSGSVVVSMKETQRAEIPNFVGAEAANITQQGNPYIFRTSLTQLTSMPKVARYLKDTVKAKSVALIWVNNDFGKGGRDALAKALQAGGLGVAADISTDPGQLDFSAAVLKAKQSSADAVFVYTNEEESARALKELRKDGYSKPVVGETTLTGQKVIELAGASANGAAAHVGLTADAPSPLVKAFAEHYEAIYHSKPDHNSIKGYTAPWIMKAGTEQIGKADSKALAKALHGIHLSAAKVPGVLLDMSYDDNGDIDRESFMVKVVDGKQQVFMTLPANGSR
jgi:branched-chain amino acid transport system substrate-binding protein